jgi:hypothetical protein
MSKVIISRILRPAQSLAWELSSFHIPTRLEGMSVVVNHARLDAVSVVTQLRNKSSHIAHSRKRFNHIANEIHALSNHVVKVRISIQASTAFSPITTVAPPPLAPHAPRTTLRPSSLPVPTHQLSQSHHHLHPPPTLPCYEHLQSQYRTPPSRTHAMISSGFTNAPVTQFLVFGTVIGALLATITDSRYYLPIQVVPHIWQYGQFWRFAVWQVCLGLPWRGQ